MSYSSTNNPFTNASAGFSSNNKSINNSNNKFTNNTNNLEKLYEPKWDTKKYKNRWEDPNYVKDLRYDMDWSN